MSDRPLVVVPEIRQALAEKKPVVALETCILSHGMPYPQNLETVRSVQEIIRKNGAVPATIGIIKGAIRVGLNDEQLQIFAHSEGIVKVSVRDLPWVLVNKNVGATTVAATMVCAQMAGISVFVTGGIGGVHRQAERTMDVSADLTELSRSNVAVICAGAKSVLDQAKTLEYLETKGVPVIGYRTDQFPFFYSRSTGLPVNCRMDTPAEVAELMHAKWCRLGLNGGIVVANPVPQGEGLDSQSLERLLSRATEEAEKKGISGKEVTPFLLSRLAELTGGASLQANIALIRHNAEVGAKIACAYAELEC